VNPSGGSNQSTSSSAVREQSISFDALNTGPLRNDLNTDPDSTQAIISAEEHQAHQQQLAHQKIQSRKRTIKFALIAVVLLIGLVGVFLRHGVSTKNLGSTNADASQRFATTSIPLGSLTSNSAGLSVGNAQTLSINGQLNVNNSLVIAPTTQPNGAVTGQMYYDQTTNQLSYFNGSEFTSLLTGNQKLVSSFGGTSGDITTGQGLGVNGNTVSNTGVLTLQGQAGNVTLVGSTGIAVNGTQLSNSGVLSLGGQNGNILIGNGLNLSGNTLSAQSGIQAISAATNNVVITNQGNGDYTIGVTVAGGNGAGTVASSGGTVGQFAYFAGVQDIENSLVSQNGTTVTVSGSLNVSGSLVLGAPLTVANGGTGGTTQSTARSGIGAAASGVNNDIASLTGLTTALSVSQGGIGVGILPTNSVLVGNGTSAISGVTSGSAGLCLVSTAGVPSFQTCPGSGGVASINTLTGPLTIAGASAGSVSSSGTTITLNDATNAVKGLASFSGTNFTVSNGAVNTIQNISVSSAPTFGQLMITSSQAAADMLTINNTDAGATGNLLNLELSGLSKLSVAANGNLTSGLINGQTISNAASFTGSVSVGGTLSVNTISPTGALTVGVGSQPFTLQGNASSAITATSGANSTTVGFQAPTASVTYDFATASTGTYNVCTTAGNCVGAGGAVSSPGGTANTLAKFTGGNTLGNSIITDNGSTVTIGGALSANTITPTGALTVGSTGQNLTLQGASVSVADTSGGVTNSLVFTTPSSSNKTITLPNATGTVAVSATGPLSLDTNGNLTCPTCLTSGGGGGSSGVSSVNSANGALILQGTSAGSITTAGTTITINDATSAIKGLASFNATDLKVTSGNVDTIQSIAVTSTPTFAGLNLTAALTVANGGTGGTTQSTARSGIGAAASGVNNDITSLTGLTTALSVSQGGIGATSLTANGVLVGNGTSPVSAVTGSNGQCLMLVSGTPAFGTCPGAGATPVSSLNTLTGALTINNSTTSGGNTVIINNAAADGSTKGIAAFNGTNFIAAGGVINTVQNINSGASPTFNGLSLSNALTVANGGTGGTTQSTARSGIGAAASGVNNDITSLTGLTTALSVSQGGIGLSALTSNEILFANSTSSVSQLSNGTSGLCLMSNGATFAPTFQTCTGAGGVSSVDSQSGSITIANSTGSTGVITIANALADGSTKGIATFNATNFSASGGVVNTIQGISSSSTPTFAGLNLSTALTIANGGTGLTTLTADGILYASSTSAISQLGVGSSGQCLISNGAGFAPTWQACPGGGSSPITGSGTSGSIAVFNGTSSLTNSDITDSAGTVSIASGVALQSLGTTLFKDSTNSTTAFQIQNSSGVSLLTADTTDNCLGVRGTCLSNASGVYIPWVSGDGNATVTVGSTNSSDTQNAIVANTYNAIAIQGNNTDFTGSGIGVEGTSNAPTGEGVYAYASNGGTGLLANADGGGNAIQGSASSGYSGYFKASSPTNTNTTLLVANASGSSTANLFQADQSNLALTSLFTIGATGSVASTNNTNSTTAFQIQNASGTDIFNTDTTNGRIGINKNTPGYALDVNGSINTNTSYLLNGISINTSGTLSNVAYLPGTQTFTGVNTFQPATNVSGVIIKQTSVASPTADVFDVQTSNAATNYIQVTSTGANAGGLNLNTTSGAALNIGTANADVITIGNSNSTNALKLQGSGITETITGGSTAPYPSDIIKTSTASTTAFAVQNASSVSILDVDTQNARVTVNSTGTPFILNMTASGDENGILFETNAISTGEIGIVGAAGQIVNQSASGDLALKSSSGNIYLAAGGSNAEVSIDTNGNTTFKNTVDSTTNSFQVQNAGGVNLIAVNTMNRTVTIGAGGSDLLASTVNIGTSTGTYQSVTVGSSVSSSTTAIQAGSITQTITGAASNPSDIIKTGTNSTQAFQIQNTSGYSVLNVNTTSSILTLGNKTASSGQGVAGSLGFADGTNDNNLVTINTATLSNSYTVSLPATGASGLQCLQSTSGSTTSTTALTFGSCTGTSANLQQAYNSSAGASPSIDMTNTFHGFTVQNDNANPITGELFGVHANVSSGLGASLFSVANNGNLAATSSDIVSTDTAFNFTSSEQAGSALGVTANSLTTGNGVNISTTSAAQTSGSVLNVSDTATLATSGGNVGGSLLNVSRSLTSNVTGSSGGPTLDTATTYQLHTATANPWTNSFTVGNNSNRYLIVAVTNGSNCDPSAVTYGGSRLQLIGPPTYVSQDNMWWYAMPAPAIGANNLVITPDAVTDCGTSSTFDVMVDSWYNVNQTTPYGTFSYTNGGSGTPSLSATSVSGRIVVDGVYSVGATTLTKSAGQTLATSVADTTNSVAIGSSYKTAAGATTTMSWTNTGGVSWGADAIDLISASGSESVSSPVASLSDNCAITAGTCADSSNVLNIAQQFSGASGTALNIQDSGTGDAVDILDSGSGTGFAETITDTSQNAAGAVNIGTNLGVGLKVWSGSSNAIFALTASASSAIYGFNYGTAGNGYGVGGYSDGGAGVYGEGDGASTNGVVGQGSGTGDGVDGYSTNGAGVLGSSTANVSGYFQAGATNIGYSTLVSIQDGSSTDNLFQTDTSSFGTLFNLAYNGNVTVNNTSGATAVVINASNVSAGGYNAAATVIDVAKASDGRSINAAGTINATGADYGEYFYQAVPGQLQPGDVACLTAAGDAEQCGSNSDSLIGVVATNPGVVGNDIYDPAHPDNTAIISMLGQVPVHVSDTNGPIHVGDMLTYDPKTGLAVKATSASMAIGEALEDFSGGTGTIQIYIHVGYYDPMGLQSDGVSNGYVVQGGDASLSNLTVSGNATISTLDVTGSATISDLVVTTSLTTASITINGHIVTGGATPATTVGANAGTAADVAITGNDTSGKVSITLGSNPSVGELAKLTFAQAYGSAPIVVITAGNSNAAQLQQYVTPTSTGFSLNAATTNGLSSGQTYTFYYHVMQ
jgi:hypothetical protein